MYLTIPFFLIIISSAGILFIIRRKMPYINKLESIQEDSDLNWNFKLILEDFFPELSKVFKESKIKEYRNISLIEIEKLLRKLRLLTLKMDSTSGSLIKKVRGFHLKPAPLSVANKEETKVENGRELSQEDLKENEHRLIIEIAKDPKNPKLYEELGDLYVKMGSSSDAAESYKTAHELDPENKSLLKKASGF